MSDADWGADNSTMSKPYAGEVDSVDGGAKAGASPMGTFPTPTIIEIRMSGRVTLERREYGYPVSASWGPRGSGDNHLGSMGLLIGGDMWWPGAQGNPEEIVDTLLVEAGMSINALRNGAGNQPLGDASHCGSPGYALCWSWSGQANASFSRLPAKLIWVSQPPARTPNDSLVSFTVGVSPEKIKGIPVPMSRLRWRWVPSAPGGDSTACEASPGRTCEHRMQGAGRMIVTAYVNGQQQQLEGQTMGIGPVRPKCADDSVFSAAHPELANPAMDSAIKKLWADARYSPDSSYTNRQEVGGWIVKPPNAPYRFVRWAAGGKPCDVDPDSVVPAYVVAEVHVHPFGKNDSVYPCGPDSAYVVSPGHWATYPGGASGDTVSAPDAPWGSGDYGSLKWLSQKSGHQVTGLILDNDGIIVYLLSDLDSSGNPKLDAASNPLNGKYFPRCSY